MCYYPTHSGYFVCIYITQLREMCIYITRSGPKPHLRMSEKHNLIVRVGKSTEFRPFRWGKSTISGKRTMHYALTGHSDGVNAQFQVEKTIDYAPAGHPDRVKAQFQTTQEPSPTRCGPRAPTRARNMQIPPAETCQARPDASPTNHDALPTPRPHHTPNTPPLAFDHTCPPRHAPKPNPSIVHVMRRFAALEQKLASAESARLCIHPDNESLRRSLRARMLEGEVVEPYRGLYARRQWWMSHDYTERCRIVLRTLSKNHPTWIFTHASAAVMHGLDGIGRRLQTIEVATSSKSHIRSTPSCRRRAATDIKAVKLDGVRVTSLERTVFDCARHYSFPEGLAVADAALRHGTTTLPKLMQAATAFRGYGKAQFDQALHYATGKTDNGGESFAYGVMIELGFALPQLQQTVTNPTDPTRKYRVDFLWTSAQGKIIVGELDGKVKYADDHMLHNGDLRQTLLNEKYREDQLRLIVDKVVRFSFADVIAREPLWQKLRRAEVPLAACDWRREQHT